MLALRNFRRNLTRVQNFKTNYTMKFIIDKTERRLKNITYQTDHDLYATYKGYDIQVAEQETGGFYATVKDPKGKKIIDNHVGGLYLNEAVKDVMITICFKISRESAKRLNEAQTEQCNIPHVSKTKRSEVAVCDHSHGFYFDEKGIITCARCHPPKK